ncbi:hypothetical protein TNCV_1142071 [Trichonephila clavipes]|nr:hypothetical protein TNCV_1142071 [Trichonephila clavipes]
MERHNDGETCAPPRSSGRTCDKKRSIIPSRPKDYAEGLPISAVDNSKLITSDGTDKRRRKRFNDHAIPRDSKVIYRKRVNKHFYAGIYPNFLKNHKTQKLAEGIKILGMIQGIRFDHLYSDILIS